MSTTEHTTTLGAGHAPPMHANRSQVPRLTDTGVDTGEGIVLRFPPAMPARSAAPTSSVSPGTRGVPRRGYPPRVPGCDTATTSPPPTTAESFLGTGSSGRHSMAEYSPARTWARKVCGPVPPRRPHTGPGPATPEEIAAAWYRFRRITTGESGAEEMWDERQDLVADLPVRPGRDEHVPLVIDEYFGVCGAERCYYLGPDRDNEAAALADAQEHCAAMAKKALRAAKTKS